MTYGNISGSHCFETNFKWEPKLVDDIIHLSLLPEFPTSMYMFFSHYWVFSSLFFVEIFSASCPNPPYIHLCCPRTHGHTEGACCGCSTVLSPDTLLWPQRLPGGGSLRCSCTQPWSPLCILYQKPFHSWEPQEAHRKELAEGKKMSWACLLHDGVLRTHVYIFIFPLPWDFNKII